MINIVLATVAVLTLGACATNTGVLPTTNGNYTVMRQGTSFLVSTAELKSQAMQEASAFCASKSKKEVKVIHVKEIPAGAFGRWPETEVLFTCE